MAQIINTFPLSIYRDSIVVDPVLKNRLIEVVTEMHGTKCNTTQGKTWTGDVNKNGFLHKDERFRELFKLFEPVLKGYLSMLSIKDDLLSLHYVRSWATLSQQGEKVDSHSHKPANISFAYYLKMPPNGGDFVAINRDPQNEFTELLFRQENTDKLFPWNTRSHIIKPEENDIFVFPSKTIHSTQPSETMESRISIACDIVATVKNPEVEEFILPDPAEWEKIF